MKDASDTSLSEHTRIAARLQLGTRSPQTAIIVSGVLLVGFVFLALVRSAGFFATNPFTIRQNPSSLVFLVERITMLGEAWVVAGVVLLAAGWHWWRRGSAWEAGGAVAAFLLAALAVWVLKALFGVDRPEGALIAEQGFSYPSGHATLSLVGYGLAAWLWEARLVQRRALIAYALTLALAIGISRVLLGVHTVADVAGGFLLGGAILLLTRTLLEGGRGGCSR